MKSDTRMKSEKLKMKNQNKKNDELIKFEKWLVIGEVLNALQK